MPSQQLPDHLTRSFLARPAEQVAPELIGCLGRACLMLEGFPFDLFDNE